VKLTSEHPSVLADKDDEAIDSRLFEGLTFNGCSLTRLGCMKLSVLPLSIRLSASIPFIKILAVAFDSAVGTEADVIVARVGR